MIPHVAKRGHSFKGIGAYMLNSKKETPDQERVGWTHTHNLPTDDPNKAMRVMACTSMNAEYLKEQAGVKRSGQKATAGSVYHFSLSWHPDEKPEKEEMLKASFETLERLGLKNHEVVLVNHKDEPHAHVHAIVNLVHPETGRTASMSNDRKKLSTWANEYELKNGKEYCPERGKNIEKRKELAQEEIKKDRRNRQEQYKNDFNKNGKSTLPKPETGIVKHREARLKRAEQIQSLYQRSDSAKSFQAALGDSGYQLAKGDRRGLVLVDEAGKIHSLSRQLSGLWKKDPETKKWKGGLEERFEDFKNIELKSAKDLSKEIIDRQHYDRDQANIDQTNRMLDAADQAAKLPQEQSKKGDKETSIPEVSQADKDYAPLKKDMEGLEKRRIWERQWDMKKRQLEQRIGQSYGRKVLLEKIENINAELEKGVGVLGRLSGKEEKMKEELENLNKTLTNMDGRIFEQVQRYERERSQSEREYFPEQSQKEKRSKDHDSNYDRDNKPSNDNLGRSDHDHGHDMAM